MKPSLHLLRFACLALFLAGASVWTLNRLDANTPAPESARIRPNQPESARRVARLPLTWISLGAEMIRTGPVKPHTNAEPALIAQHSVKLRNLLTTYRAKARPSSSLTPAMLREQIADLEAFLIQEPDSP